MPPTYHLPTDEERRQAMLQSAQEGHLIVRGDLECLVSWLHTLVLSDRLNVGNTSNDAGAYQIVLEIDEAHDRSDLRLGGNETNGRVLLFAQNQTNPREGPQAAPTATVELVGSYGGVILSRINPDTAEVKDTVFLDARTAKLELGSNDTNGLIRLHPKQQAQFGGSATVEIQAEGGELFLRPLDGKKTAWLSSTGKLILGGNEVDGGLLLFPKAKENSADGKNSTVHISGATGSVVLSRVDEQGEVKDTLWFAAPTASLKAGGNGANGDLQLFRATAEQFGGAPTVNLNAGGALALGGQGVNGDLQLFRDAAEQSGGTPTVKLNAGGTLTLGGQGVNGGILLYPTWGNLGGKGVPEYASVHIDGQKGILNLRTVGMQIEDNIRLDPSEGCIKVGGSTGGSIELYDGASDDFGGTPTVKIDGRTGDILLTNADCAEEFTVVAGRPIEPGMVLVFDDEGALRPCDESYDRRVAGVVAGGGACKPGMILGHQPGRHDRQPIALSGKVYCKADAAGGAIRVGDLLTTSHTPGHAMKATDPSRAFGAVIGKAMRPLEAGCGLIPILVALQ